ncbi:MAG TPA: S-methyl-5-thioribose-1-phosphate isomerase [Syntrophomonadaceae bacterium]|nr:S-methyl-5-thioribose-1-phosphate isomerase [Syntrophomonadaceae bacterium]
MEVVYWEGQRLVLLDQTKLPHQTTYVTCSHYQEVAEAIYSLKVRGAPAIGVAAAYGCALAAFNYRDDLGMSLEQFLDQAGRELLATRPTAVNLRWALERMNDVYQNIREKSLENVRSGLLEAALQIHDRERKLEEKMATFGASLVPPKANILTYCNTGALATAGWGTALGVIRAAHNDGKNVRVFVPETRPVLQGARLTAWELHGAGIPYTLITDNMLGYVFLHEGIDLVLVGADRIVSNGDFANKIGTYGLAVLAKYHQCPFYVVAPSSTIDLNLKEGKEIPIEMRDPREVREIRGQLVSVKNCAVLNPAFDVTPHDLVTAVITEKGVLSPPFKKSIKSSFDEEGAYR